MISSKLVLLWSSIFCTLLSISLGTKTRLNDSCDSLETESDITDRALDLKQLPERYKENPRPRISISLIRDVKINEEDSSIRAPRISYFGKVAIGTSPRIFKVVFDTSYSSIWLPEYNKNPIVPNLHYTNGYSCKESSTCKGSKKKIATTYRFTGISGKNYTDVFRLIGHESSGFGCLSFNQSFIGVYDADDEEYKDQQYDGVIGLAPVEQSDLGFRSILLSLHKSKLCEIRKSKSSKKSTYQNTTNKYIPPNHPLLFSFWFNPDQKSTDGGRLTLGGIDEYSYKGELHYHELVGLPEPKSWSVQLTRVKFGNQVISCPNGCEAKVDTAVISIVGPRNDLELVYEKLQAQYDSASDLWLVDCEKVNQYPQLTLKIDTVSYIITAKQYVKSIPHTDPSICYVGIRPYDGEGWILGTTFITTYYTVFDFINLRIGLANAR